MERKSLFLLAKEKKVCGKKESNRWMDSEAKRRLCARDTKRGREKERVTIDDDDDVLRGGERKREVVGKKRKQEVCMYNRVIRMGMGTEGGGIG